MSRIARTLALSLLLAPAACGTLDRLSRVGQAPEMAAIANPTADPAWRPVSMPMPGPQEPPVTANSLWRQGSRTFLRDQRASAVGDIVTVLVSIQDQAQLQNQTDRSRTGIENLGAPYLLGLETSYARFLPNAIRPDKLIETSSTSSTQGNGSVRRNESVTLRVAATVTQTLPNGNLVLSGRQQVRVNHELRDLNLTGVVRPSDIAGDNTIRHDRLAEARIAYGGRGTISDAQQARYGQQALDALLPF